MVVAVAAIAGCARPVDVELRLYPCALQGVTATRVELEIIGFDGDGGELPRLSADFEVPPDVLADGYATVGLRKPEGMVTADFIMVWHGTDGVHETSTLRNVVVPEPGAVVELGAEMCSPADTDTTAAATGTTTGDTTTSDTTLGDTTIGDTSTSGPNPDTSTTDATTSTTTDATTGTSTGDPSSSTGDETTGDETTGEPPSMVGQPCAQDYYCENSGPGQIGTLLHCPDKGNSNWILANLENACIPFDLFCPPETGLVAPFLVGCSGEGTFGWACVCQDGTVCDPDVEVGCDTLNGDHYITMCPEDDQGMPMLTKARCLGTCDVDDNGQPECGDL